MEKEVVFTEFMATSGYGRVVAREDGHGQWDITVQSLQDGEWTDHEHLGYTPSVGVELPAQFRLTE